jgi:hypothetical protein
MLSGVDTCLPTVDFCGLKVTRLIIGANPFGGFSHQSKQRDRDMLAYYSPQRIIETWHRAEAAGINTMITNNETPSVIDALRQYLSGGGKLQWIAQLNCIVRHKDMIPAIDEAIDIGCKAVYFHGALVDRAYAGRDERTIRDWCRHAQSRGVPAGVAAHLPEAHLWVNGLNAADFHVVCFFRCGSLHEGKGERFALRDMPAAVDCIRRIAKPCIAYKIMGAGRIDPRMAFEYAFEGIKPTDVINVGVHRGDKDDMVEDNVAIVRAILAT